MPRKTATYSAKLRRGNGGVRLNTLQNRPCIKGGSIGRIVSVPRGRQSAGRPFRCGPQPSQYLLDSSVALGDLGLVEVVKVQRLTEGEYVLLTPIAGQSSADLLS